MSLNTFILLLSDMSQSLPETVKDAYHLDADFNPSQTLRQAVGAMRTYMKKRHDYIVVSTIADRSGHGFSSHHPSAYETQVFGCSPFGDFDFGRRLYGDESNRPIQMHQNAVNCFAAKGYQVTGFERQNYQEHCSELTGAKLT